tara:strand:+ start:35 stop:151 length:117 start_codon:yes stop_codon:yes gene_type:complete
VIPSGLINESSLFEHEIKTENKKIIIIDLFIENNITIL